MVETTPAPPPPVMAPPVVAAPVETTPPPSQPVPVAPTAKTSAPDPRLARVEVGVATSTTGTTASNVNKTIAPLASKITACYRNALSRVRDAADESSVLHVQTNEDGVITEAHIARPLTIDAAPCIVAAVRGRRISNVDTGSASADVPLAFKVR